MARAKIDKLKSLVIDNLNRRIDYALQNDVPSTLRYQEASNRHHTGGCLHYSINASDLSYDNQITAYSDLRNSESAWW